MSVKNSQICFTVKKVKPLWFQHNLIGLVYKGNMSTRPRSREAKPPKFISAEINFGLHCLRRRPKLLISAEIPKRMKNYYYCIIYKKNFGRAASLVDDRIHFSRN